MMQLSATSFSIRYYLRLWYALYLTERTVRGTRTLPLPISGQEILIERIQKYKFIFNSHSRLTRCSSRLAYVCTKPFQTLS